MPQALTLLLVAVLHTAVGLLIGMRLRRNDRKAFQQSTFDHRHARKMLTKMHVLASDVAADVSAHVYRIDDANRQLTLVRSSNADSPPTAPDSVTQILDANIQLRRKLVSAEEQVQQQADQLEAYMAEARTDSLTCLTNRRGFDEVLQRRVGERRHRKTPVSLLLLDVDHFKTFNDRYGHTAGDKILRQLARILSDQSRDTDVVARVGGEEFGAVLFATDLNDAAVAAERFRTAVEANPIRVERDDLKVTISVGVAEAIVGEMPEVLFRRADTAVYASKQAGRNMSHMHNGNSCVPLGPAAVPSRSERSSLVHPPNAISAFISKLTNGAAPSITAGQTANGAERRSQTRFAVSTVLEARRIDESLQNEGEAFKVVTRDISAGGVPFLHPRKPDAKHLALQLKSPCGDQMHVAMEVVRCRPVGHFYELGGKFVTA